MKEIKKSLISILTLSLSACSSLKVPQRVFLDSTLKKDSPPEWVNQVKVSWEDKDKVFMRSSYTARGNERVAGCFDLARLDAKEKVLSEVNNDVRGSLDNAQQSISENAEAVLGKVRTASFEGKVRGLRFSEEYFERYLIGETERLNCHVLGEMKLSDYNDLKRAVVDELSRVDARLKEAITKKQIDFFESKKQERVPAEKEATEESN
ncbi:hypothetical protein EBR03_00905 [bacterium]|nr:hypothetical protein [bacterium]